MPSRSPHRRSPPPPPLISRHSPSRGRVRSPARHRPEMSTERERDRREYRPSIRRSRSPPQVRPFSPPLKRKISPGREKEIPRRAKISQSPVSLRGGSEHRPYVSPETETHVVRTVSETNSFRVVGKDMEESECAVPQFRGPDGTLDFDINELKKFTVEIIRKPSTVNEESLISRNIINPDNIVPVRRPGMRGATHFQEQRRDLDTKHFPPPPRWDAEDPFLYDHEGARPLFSRAEVVPAPGKDKSLPPEDYRRVVSINIVRGSRERDHSRERTKLSAGPYEDSRQPQYYHKRELSPYDSRRQSPPREKYYDNRNKVHERAGTSREEFRGDDNKRRVQRKYSVDRQSFERESDLRSRINEKRDPLGRPDEREHVSKRYELERERHELERERIRRGHEMERKRPTRSQEKERDRPRPSHEVDRERSGRSHEMQRTRPGRLNDFEKERSERERPRRSQEMDRERPRRSSNERERVSRTHHSPSSSKERRRPGSLEISRERAREGFERESGGERRRRHSRERDGRPRERSDHYEEKRYKPDSESKKVYRSYEDNEFSSATRGRGGLSIRRGIPLMGRGRGMLRGMPRFPRGGIMIPRGLPRPPPFMGIPRFPPRKSTY